MQNGQGLALLQKSPLDKVGGKPRRSAPPVAGAPMPNTMVIDSMMLNVIGIAIPSCCEARERGAARATGLSSLAL